jgi:mono/diheme cytochrome c family protein
MKRPGHYHPAIDTVEKGVARSCLRRRASASRSLLSVAIGLIGVAGPALIFAASQAGGHAGQAATHSSKSAAAPAGNADHGKQLFRRYGCYECHGSHGQIASRTGPALAPDLIPFEGFAAYVRHPAGSMPPYTEKVVSDQDVVDIYAFLQTTSPPPAAKTVPLLNLVAGRP